MISTEAVGLAINIATGIIKLAGRVDLVLAEREAVEAPLALPQAPVALAPGQSEMREALQKLLQDEPQDPDALADDREAIRNLLGQSSPSPADLYRYMKRYLPMQSRASVLDLDSEFMKALQEARPGFPLDQQEVRIAAYFINAGRADGGRDYTWKIALTVVDALAEFGAENAAMFTHDPKIQGIVGSVLKRFGEADLQTADRWGDLLKKALCATLNGALDSRASLSRDASWLATVLNAMATARDSVPAAERDNFLLGLLKGDGYTRLVGALLGAGAGRVASKHTAVFGQIATDLLKEGGELIGESPSFRDFFQDHWGDLVHAGFKSLNAHGSGLVKSKSPILGPVLISVTRQLAETPGRDVFSESTLLSLVDVSVRTVASNPTLLLKKIDSGWMKTLVTSVAAVLADEGLAQTFSTQGLEAILTKSLASFAEQPELLVKRPGLVQELLGDVLAEVSKKGSFAVADLADAAVKAALDGIARRPDLLPLKYAAFVANLAGSLSESVEEESLTRLQAKDLLAVILKAAEANPPLFLNGKIDSARLVLDVVLRAASGDGASLLAGDVLGGVVDALLGAFARGAQRKLDEGGSAAALTKELLALLKAGLSRADSELGHTMSLDTLPETLGLLVTAWLRGNVGVVDADNTAFRRLFSELADRAAA